MQLQRFNLNLETSPPPCIHLVKPIFVFWENIQYIFEVRGNARMVEHVKIISCCLNCIRVFNQSADGTALYLGKTLPRGIWLLSWLS